jgi:hypothetical protein
VRKQKFVVNTLFKFPNILRTPESLRLPKTLKLMAWKESRAALHHKGLEPKNVPRQRGQISLGYYTNTKGKPKVQLPTNVEPKGKTTNVGNKEGGVMWEKLFCER